METFMIQSVGHMPQRLKNISINTNKTTTTLIKMFNFTNESQDVSSNFSTYSGLLFDPNATVLWNSSDIYNLSSINNSFLDYDYQSMNETVPGFDNWSHCRDWTSAQHNLYQTANFLLVAAFIIPGSFKQSVLLVRAILTVGYILLSSWAGSYVCSLDLILWNVLFLILNLTHSVVLTWRFLPPTLTLELTDLYLKVFQPFRVSKKHFKELVKEAKVINLEKGDIYAVEDVSPADERLSILLGGKFRVTCDDTHLHFISYHQFVDSPEWEANHEQSDDVFQVTITAEEDSVYLCWPRMRLERVLRHRPMLKIVLDAIIGKDITQKLYSLNEHLSGLHIERERTMRENAWEKTHPRSMSMDAVNTGTSGLVRSNYYKNVQRSNSFTSNEIMGSMTAIRPQSYTPVVAHHFPLHSPFILPSIGIDQELPPPEDTTSTTALLKVPSLPVTPQRTRSFKRNREVKFKNY